MKKLFLTAAMAMVLLNSFAQQPKVEGWTESDIKKANTAINTSLPQELKDVYLYCNLARLNGKQYGETCVKSILQYYPSNDPDIESLLKDLENKKDLPMLYPAQGLIDAAQEHVDKQGPTGQTGHDSPDGSRFSARVRAHFSCSGVAENIYYPAKTGFEMVMKWLIDKGVESRGHRYNIINEKYHSMGVASGSHAKYGTMCVLDLANCEAGTDLVVNNDDTNNNQGGDENINNNDENNNQVEETNDEEEVAEEDEEYDDEEADCEEVTDEDNDDTNLQDEDLYQDDEEDGQREGHKHHNHHNHNHGYISEYDDPDFDWEKYVRDLAREIYREEINKENHHDDDYDDEE